MSERRANPSAVIEWICVATVFLGVLFVTAYTQKPLTYQRGHGWDGVEYYAMAQDFAACRAPAGITPFVNRIASPILAASLSPRDPMRGFRILNIFASVLTAVLFSVWLKYHLTDWRVRVLMLFLYLTCLVSPFRNSFFYPVTTDTLTHLGIITGVLLLYHLEHRSPRVAGICMACFGASAVPVREVMIVFSCAVFFLGNPLSADRKSLLGVRLKRWPSPWLLLPIVVSGLTFYLIRHWVVTRPGWYSLASHTVWALYNKSLLQYLLGWFITYGPMLSLVLWKWRDSVEYLRVRQVQAALLLAVTALGWIAGTDTERFLIWAFPIVLVLVGRVIERNLWVFRMPLILLVFVLTQALSQRYFWPLPDYPPAEPLRHPWVVLSAWGMRINVLDLYSYHASKFVSFPAFVEYSVLAFGLVVCLRYAEMRRAEANLLSAGAARGQEGA
jgi:hypothetical protein